MKKLITVLTMTAALNSANAIVLSQELVEMKINNIHERLKCVFLDRDFGFGEGSAKIDLGELKRADELFAVPIRNYALGLRNNHHGPHDLLPNPMREESVVFHWTPLECGKSIERLLSHADNSGTLTLEATRTVSMVRNNSNWQILEKVSATLPEVRNIFAGQVIVSKTLGLQTSVPSTVHLQGIEDLVGEEERNVRIKFSDAGKAPDQDTFSCHLRPMRFMQFASMNIDKLDVIDGRLSGGLPFESDYFIPDHNHRSQPEESLAECNAKKNELRHMIYYQNGIVETNVKEKVRLIDRSESGNKDLLNINQEIDILGEVFRSWAQIEL